MARSSSTSFSWRCSLRFHPRVQDARCEALQLDRGVASAAQARARDEDYEELVQIAGAASAGRGG